MDWTTGDVVAAGLKLHYYRTGGEKPPVVLAHGFTDNGLCWTRLALELQESYDVVMYDALGHGLSDAPQVGYSVPEQARNLATIVRALHLARPALVGHSMGAVTVAAAAAHYPELARCVVLEDPPWWSEGTGPSLNERASMSEEWRQANVLQKAMIIEDIIASGREEHPTWEDVEWHPWAESKRQVSLYAFRELAAPQPPWQNHIRRISCPMLLITADPKRGGIVTQETAQEIAGIWRDGRVCHFREAGHSVRREAFEGYLTEVTGFLAES
jgi:pimeloyl-ACP methyl ester carboxylesterase